MHVFLKVPKTHDYVKFLVSMYGHSLKWKKGRSLKCQQKALLPNSPPLYSSSAAFQEHLPEHTDWLKQEVMWCGSLLKVFFWEWCLLQHLLHMNSLAVIIVLLLLLDLNTFIIIQYWGKRLLPSTNPKQSEDALLQRQLQFKMLNKLWLHWHQLFEYFTQILESVCDILMMRIKEMVCKKSWRSWK